MYGTELRYRLESLNDRLPCEGCLNIAELSSTLYAYSNNPSRHAYTDCRSGFDMSKPVRTAICFARSLV